ncbi:hypothetical protein AMS68_004955 [Peltaster fructicola]|uniref:Uncharacterized protein n=1 Tax=Peltaster fructicola TaxID=286661 RepID=A0A6H0XXW8_9PEZI|nr:hypothetical protein AMS68_004955 [Peltaster fructicola]
MKVMRKPEEKEAIIRQTVERITSPLYKVLACQEPFPVAQVTRTNGNELIRLTNEPIPQEMMPPITNINSSLLDMNELDDWTFQDWFSPADFNTAYQPAQDMPLNILFDPSRSDQATHIASTLRELLSKISAPRETYATACPLPIPPAAFCAGPQHYGVLVEGMLLAIEPRCTQGTTQYAFELLEVKDQPCCRLVMLLQSALRTCGLPLNMHIPQPFQQSVNEITIRTTSIEALCIMSSKIDKVIARQQVKIAEGEYYEAHQQLRTIANRYVKSKDYTSAVELLSNGAQLLLRAGQGGSGADLCVYIMEVYDKAELKVDTANKARLLGLLRAFPQGEAAKKKFVGGIVEWSTKYGEYPAGDPELHHVIGKLFAEEGEVYDAERHLTLGTSDSAQAFADLEYEWYASDELSTAPAYAARAVLPYLLVGNTRAANKALLLFTSRLSSSHPGLSVQSISSSASDIRVYPSLPLLNFLGLLLLAVQRGGADLYKQLKAHYAAQLKETGWDEALAQIGEMYFGIKIPSQSNPMFDMMSSMLMGGNNPFAAKKKEQKTVTAEAASPAPPAPGLD